MAKGGVTHKQVTQFYRVPGVTFGVSNLGGAIFHFLGHIELGGIAPFMVSWLEKVHKLFLLCFGPRGEKAPPNIGSSTGSPIGRLGGPFTQ